MDPLIKAYKELIATTIHNPNLTIYQSISLILVIQDELSRKFQEELDKYVDDPDCSECPVGIKCPDIVNHNSAMCKMLYKTKA
jgi:hypothetical protein